MRSRHPVVSRILLLGILVNLLCLMARLGSIPREYNQAADLWCIYSFLTICYCGLSCYIMYRMCRGKKIMPFFILSFPVFFLFSGILLPSERSAMSFAEQLSCQEHMLTIRLACLAYAEDHDGNYPSSLELLWNRDIPIWNIRFCIVRGIRDSVRGSATICITVPDLSREKSRNIICFWRTSPVIIFKSAVFQNFT